MSIKKLFDHFRSVNINFKYFDHKKIIINTGIDQYLEYFIDLTLKFKNRKISIVKKF